MADTVVIPPTNQPRALTVADVKQAIEDALAAGLAPSAVFSVDDGVIVGTVYGTVHGRWQSDGRPYFAVTTTVPRG